MATSNTQLSYFKLARWAAILAVVAVLIIPPLVFDDPMFYTKFGYLGFVIGNMILSVYLVLPLFISSFQPAILVLLATAANVAANYLGWWLGQAALNNQSASSKKPEADQLPGWVQRLLPWIETYGKPAIFVLSTLPLPNIIFSLPGYTSRGRLSTLDFLILNTLGKLIRNAAYAAFLLWLL